MARSAARAAPSSTWWKSRMSSADWRQRQRGAGGPGTPMVQAGHGVEQVGEAGGTGGQCRAGLGVGAGGMADLGAGAEPAKRGQQRAVGVDLGRVGGDPDRGEACQLLEQGEIGRDGERRLRAQGIRADERALPDARRESARPAPGCRHRRGDARHRPPQVVGGRRDRRRQQRGRAVARVEPRHVPDRVGAVHAIGAVAAMHVQIDEARAG